MKSAILQDLQHQNIDVCLFVIVDTFEKIKKEIEFRFIIFHFGHAIFLQKIKFFQNIFFNPHDMSKIFGWGS